MKKTVIALIIVALFICSTSVVFARIDCDHSYGYGVRPIFRQLTCKSYVEYEEKYCLECGTVLGSMHTHYGTNNVHVGGRYSEIIQISGIWYRLEYCNTCDALLGRTQL